MYDQFDGLRDQMKEDFVSVMRAFAVARDATKGMHTQMGRMHIQMGRMHTQMGKMHDQMGTIQVQMGKVQDQVGKVQEHMGTVEAQSVIQEKALGRIGRRIDDLVVTVERYYSDHETLIQGLEEDRAS